MEILLIKRKQLKLLKRENNLIWKSNVFNIKKKQKSKKVEKFHLQAVERLDLPLVKKILKSFIKLKNPLKFSNKKLKLLIFNWKRKSNLLNSNNYKEDRNKNKTCIKKNKKNYKRVYKKLNRGKFQEKKRYNN